jgi:DnaJ-class molecular chaperone
MNTIEAMTLLRLTYTECKDSVAIKRAWKIQMRVSHPDKNLHADEESTRLTQRINTAKDFLLKGLSSRGYDDYNELEHSRKMAVLREEISRQERMMQEIQRFEKMEEESEARHARVYANFFREAREMEEKYAKDNAKRCKGPSLDTPHPMARTWLETRRRKLAKSAC